MTGHPVACGKVLATSAVMIRIFQVQFDFHLKNREFNSIFWGKTN